MFLKIKYAIIMADEFSSAVFSEKIRMIHSGLLAMIKNFVQKGAWFGRGLFVQTNI